MILVFLRNPHRGWPATELEWRTNLLTTKTGRRMRSIVRHLPFSVYNLMPFGSTARYDVKHIQARITDLNPTLVLGLSALGRCILPSLWSGPLICTPHPAAHYLVNGDPLFRAVHDKLTAGFTGRVYMNRDRGNAITEEPL